MIPIEFVVSSHVLPMYCAIYPNDQGIIYSVTTNQIDPIKGITKPPKRLGIIHGMIAVGI